VTVGEVVEYLRQCSGRELSDMLRQVFAARPEGGDEGRAFQHQLVLAVATRENVAPDDDGIEWGPWTVAVVGGAEPGEYPVDFGGEPFVQYGACPDCQVAVCSHVKKACCPLCGRPVSLT